ncbi:unnamed protein product [Chrysoparadoxa australica]
MDDEEVSIEQLNAFDLLCEELAKSRAEAGKAKAAPGVAAGAGQVQNVAKTSVESQPQGVSKDCWRCSATYRKSHRGDWWNCPSYPYCQPQLRYGNGERRTFVAVEIVLDPNPDQSEQPSTGQSYCVKVTVRANKHDASLQRQEEARIFKLLRSCGASPSSEPPTTAFPLLLPLSSIPEVHSKIKACQGLEHRLIPRSTAQALLASQVLYVSP